MSMHFQKLGLDRGIEPRVPLDFSKLEVGQKVLVYSEDRYEEVGPAKVVLVTESYVEVEFPQPGGSIGLLRLDIKGTAMDCRDLYEGWIAYCWQPRPGVWGVVDPTVVPPYPPADPLLSSLRRFLRRWAK